MSIIINNNSCFNEIIPDEIALEIFSNLNLSNLAAICRVCKKWQILVNDPFVKKSAIYKEISVFDNDKWIKYFGEGIVKDEDKYEAIASIPLNIFKEFERFKNIFVGKNTQDSLMLVRLPKTLNGNLTLKSIGELAKKYFPESQTGYNYIWPPFLDSLGDKSIPKSYWVLMTKDILPNSRNKDYNEQQEIINELSKKSLNNYEIPNTLESVICILSQYFDSNIRLFKDHPCTYIRTNNKVQSFCALVGYFIPSGLCISRLPHSGNNDIGTAVIRKL